MLGVFSSEPPIQVRYYGRSPVRNAKTLVWRLGLDRPALDLSEVHTSPHRRVLSQIKHRSVTSDTARIPRI
jgi:hypothetical protein